MTPLKVGTVNVYIQNGQGSTYYNGPVQINHAAPRLAKRDRYCCSQCGYTSDDSWQFTNGVCRSCYYLRVEAHREAELKRISAQAHGLPLIDGATGEIIEEDYRGTFSAAGALSDWQQRHPITRACAESDMVSANRAWAELQRVRLGR